MKIPYCPDEDEDGTGYHAETYPEKLVADYINASMASVGKLSYYEYRVLLRDAVIYKCNQSDSGREYLKKCWLFEQTKPDRAALRRRFGKEEKNGE